MGTESQGVRLLREGTKSILPITALPGPRTASGTALMLSKCIDRTNGHLRASHLFRSQNRQQTLTWETLHRPFQADPGM